MPDKDPCLAFLVDIFFWVMWYCAYINRKKAAVSETGFIT